MEDPSIAVCKLNHTHYLCTSKGLPCAGGSTQVNLRVFVLYFFSESLFVTVSLWVLLQVGKTTGFIKLHDEQKPFTHIVC